MLNLLYIFKLVKHIVHEMCNVFARGSCSGGVKRLEDSPSVDILTVDDTPEAVMTNPCYSHVTALGTFELI